MNTSLKKYFPNFLACIYFFNNFIVGFNFNRMFAGNLLTKKIFAKQFAILNNKFIYFLVVLLTFLLSRRSAERRVGQERRSRWPPKHRKKTARISSRKEMC
uniref:Uncharacterized protein n=1 Tax=Cacopsylla melanoneura TaxID=428564 RepID=A0A8D8R2L2_9HEMI